MKTNFKFYLTISLIAFAFTLEAAKKNRNFLKKESSIILAQTSNKETSAATLAREKGSHNRKSERQIRADETDSLGMKKKDFECLEKDDFFKAFTAEKEGRAAESGRRLSRGSRGDERRKTREACGDERKSERKQERERPRKAQREEQEGEKTQKLKQSRPEGREEVCAPASKSSEPIEKTKAEEKTKLTAAAQQGEEQGEEGEQSQGVVGEEQGEQEADSEINQQEAKGSIKTPSAQLKVGVASGAAADGCKPKEEVIESTTPEGGKALQRTFKEEKTDASKPGEKSSSKTLRSSTSENFNKCSKSASSSSSDSAKPQQALKSAGKAEETEETEAQAEGGEGEEEEGEGEGSQGQGQVIEGEQQEEAEGKQVGEIAEDSEVDIEA